MYEEITKLIVMPLSMQQISIYLKLLKALIRLFQSFPFFYALSLPNHLVYILNKHCLLGQSCLIRGRNTSNNSEIPGNWPADCEITMKLIILGLAISWTTGCVYAGGMTEVYRWKQLDYYNRGTLT